MRARPRTPRSSRSRPPAGAAASSAPSCAHSSVVRRSLRGPDHWWTLFRTDAARADRARVVWADIGRSPRAAVLAPDDATVPLNSCYVVRCPDLIDAHALAALLNGPLVSAWLGAVAEPARGGFHRYLGWTMALLPLPSEWPAVRHRLAALGLRAAAGEGVSTRALLTAALDAYRLEEDAVAPLLAWASR